MSGEGGRGFTPLSRGCLRQVGSLQAGWGMASEGAEGTRLSGADLDKDSRSGPK